MSEDSESIKLRWKHRRFMSYMALFGLIVLLIFIANNAAEAAKAGDELKAGIYSLTGIVLAYFGFSTLDDIKKP